MSSDFTYANNAPHTGDLIRFGSSGYSLQLNSTYNNATGGLSFRSYNNDGAQTWNPWRQVHHTGLFSTTDVANGKTAHGWGNHASAGYKTTDNNTQLTDAQVGEMGYIKTYTDTNTQLTTAQIAAMGYIKENENRAHSVIRFTGVGSDSKNGAQSYAIYQEGGGWSHPYPDLVIGYHTGIKIGGAKGYNGTRFYSDAPGRSGATELMSVGDGSDHINITNNLTVGGTVTASGGNSGNWNTAHGWGNHASQGYKTTDNNTQLTTAQIAAMGYIKTYTDTNTQRSDADILAVGTKAGYVTQANVNSSTVDKANGLAIVGFGDGEGTFYQTSGSFANHSGWANYWVGNHGNGSNYYNTMIAMPF
ncbi:MAG: hypothetical protein ACKVJK_17330, partial [Methylophagaceae bacterium]